MSKTARTRRPAPRTSSERFRYNNRFFSTVEFPEFEYTPELMMVAGEGSIGFFGAALKSARRQEYRFGLFRRMGLAAARALDSSNDPHRWVSLYGNWSATKQAELAGEAVKYPPIDNSIVLQLGQSGDPGVLLISYLDKRRVSEFPDFERISHIESNDREGRRGVVQSDLALLYEDYEAILRSIHGPAIEGMGATAVAGY